jgi:hypothetical protein
VKHRDYRIELFVFPDGSEIDMIVFDQDCDTAETASQTDEVSRSGAAAATADTVRAEIAPATDATAPVLDVDELLANLSTAGGLHSVGDVPTVGDRAAAGKVSATQDAQVVGERKPAPAHCCAPEPPSQDPPLSCCPICRSHLVHPMSWERTGESTWHVELRCPECELRREVTLDRTAVEHFNLEIYRGAQVMNRLSERLSRRHFWEEAERMIEALKHDLILPMDF